MAMRILNSAGQTGIDRRSPGYCSRGGSVDPRSPKNVLLTGPPGCGKTTVVRRVIEALGGLRLAGFYTEEVRERGQRVGFEIVGLGGQRCLLAHVDWRSHLRVSRYGVEPARLEPIIEAELGPSLDEVDVNVVDEIGKMECLCPSFVEAVRRVLDSPAPVLATIALKGSGFIAEDRKSTRLNSR